MPVSFFRMLRSFVLPFTMTILIPAILIWTSLSHTAGSYLRPSPVIVCLGLVLIAIGLFILVLTVKTFMMIGKGTLAPWDPPKELVISGMYRYVRNPMISGVLAIILGEALVFNTISIFYFLVLFFVMNNIYFIFVEEPGLAARFGESYIEYKAHVRRWIPRLIPYTPEK